MAPPAVAIDLSATVDQLALGQTGVADTGRELGDDPLAATMAGAEGPAVAVTPTVTVGGGRLQPAHRVGRYLILRQVGAGGMGVVFAAYDEELDRKVAVKLLREVDNSHCDRRTRILREAQAMARISHPNVVQIYEAGELTAVAGQVFIAMEFIEGTTLGEWQRPRGWEEVLPMYLAAGQGLVAAHESGLVHRDFKPDNVLIGSDGRPRVADFGLARTKAGESSPQSPAATAPAPIEPGTAVGAGSLLVSPLTQAGAILGTPAYMSAEQHRGEPTDARCDQFSFCAALYEGLYKTLPFAGQTLDELRDNVLANHLREPPPRTGVPYKVYAALRRGLAADPAQRFASMRELLEALAFDPQRDPGASPRARRSFSRVMIVLMLFVMATMATALQGGTVKPVHEIFASGLFLFGGLGAAYVWRKTLLKNEFHRGTMFLLLVASLEQIGVRGISALSGVPVHQVLPIELVMLAGFAACLSFFFFHTGWFLPPLLIGAAVWSALRPETVSVITMVAHAGSIVSMIVLWERSSRAREHEERMNGRHCFNGFNGRLSTRPPPAWRQLTERVALPNAVQSSVRLAEPGLVGPGPRPRAQLPAFVPPRAAHRFRPPRV
jgi:predicted Ser/Thr protein kinase